MLWGGVGWGVGDGGVKSFSSQAQLQATEVEIELRNFWGFDNNLNAKVNTQGHVYYCYINSVLCNKVILTNHSVVSTQQGKY